MVDVNILLCKNNPAFFISLCRWLLYIPVPVWLTIFCTNVPDFCTHLYNSYHLLYVQCMFHFYFMITWHTEGLQDDEGTVIYLRQTLGPSLTKTKITIQTRNLQIITVRWFSDDKITVWDISLCHQLVKYRSRNIFNYKSKYII